MKIFTPEGMEADTKAIGQLETCLRDERAVEGALMADHHLGYSMPIGGVISYDDAVSPTGVGYDIGCGNMAVKTDLNLNDWAPWALDEEFNGAFSEVFYDDLKKVMREIQRRVAFGVGRTTDEHVDHKLFDSEVWKEISTAFGPGLIQKARAQLGTVGSGNHYVDVLVDTSGHIWVANHFGSRGFGHTIASGFMAKAAGRDFQDKVPETEESVVLQASQGLGSFYVECMNLAGEYAYAGREYVIDQVLDTLGASAVWTVHNHHNFAWYENGLWVVRKGATPLTDKPAFIGGSMGDVSVIVKGKPDIRLDQLTVADRIQDIGNLGSAPHGAGRVMSRTAAAGKLRKMWVCPNRNCDFAPERCDGPESGYPSNHCPKCSIPLRRERIRDTSTAAIDWDDVRRNLRSRGIVVLGAGADEAPGVYKPLGDVLAAHSNIEILESLRPIGVVMAGPDEHDPYKD